MNIRKLIRIGTIVIGGLLIVSLLGLVIWSATGTYPARETALAALNSTDQVTVIREKQIEFRPRVNTETGLIFYPGGLVEPEAYAPVLRRIAEDGILVVITPMPLNLAIFNPGAAGTLIEDHPGISTWILAGHSLGGAAASIFADNNPGSIHALALWDSYPPDSADLSDSDLPVISIFGTTNGVPNTDNFNQKRRLLPPDATFVPLEGASHAQFGDYGPQKGDVEPSLSLEEQHERVADIMLDFIHNFP